MEDKEVVKIFKALCDIKRVKIIRLLQHGELCACNLLEKLDMVQSGLSYHMKILIDSNLVKCRVEGKWSHYSLSLEGREVAKEVLDSLIIVPDSSSSCSCSK
jgi:ArsR family transcriptional regulator